MEGSSATPAPIAAATARPILIPAQLIERVRPDESTSAYSKTTTRGGVGG